MPEQKRTRKKKTLEQTECVDRWKCPYCRLVNERPEAMKQAKNDIFDSEFPATCPNCGNISMLFISPTIFARPYLEE